MKIYEVIANTEQEINEGMLESLWDLVRYWNLGTPAYKAWQGVRNIKSLNKQGDPRFNTPEEMQKGIEQELTQFVVATSAMLASSAVIKRVAAFLPRLIPFFGGHPIVRLLSSLTSAGLQLYVMQWLNSEEGRTLIARWLTGQLFVGGEQATTYIGGALDTAFTKLGELLPDSVRSTIGLDPTDNQGGKSLDANDQKTSDTEDPSAAPNNLLRGDPEEYAGPGFIRDPNSGQIMPKTGIASIDNPTR